MNINNKKNYPLHCLILGAGFGTRMGNVGKKIPKILWPVFEKKIAELQIEYARSLGCKKIFINTHFLHSEIINWFNPSKYPEVTLVHEPELLLIGGAIHNIFKNYLSSEESYLLILNGDQFFMFPQQFFDSALLKLPSVRAVLFALEVDPQGGYNRLLISEKHKLEGIEKNSSSQSNNFLTYSGMGLINLKELSFVPGPSNFFDTVADYKNSAVIVEDPASAEYWDFGTLDRYKDSLIKLLFKIQSKKSDKKNDLFLSFCLKNSVIDFKKTNLLNSYNEASANDEIVVGASPHILKIKPNISGLYYNDILDSDLNN